VAGRILPEGYNGVRSLLRKYEVEQSFTRSGAIEAVRDEDKATGAVGFNAFKQLVIEARELSTELRARNWSPSILTKDPKTAWVTTGTPARWRIWQGSPTCFT
jgi:hypothetical protein